MDLPRFRPTGPLCPPATCKPSNQIRCTRLDSDGGRPGIEYENNCGILWEAHLYRPIHSRNRWLYIRETPNHMPNYIQGSTPGRSGLHDTGLNIQQFMETVLFYRFDFQGYQNLVSLFFIHRMQLSFCLCLVILKSIRWLPCWQGR